MATLIIMPRLGDFMTEGLVAKWAKGSGDKVSQGEPLVEIESEKLNYDLEAAEDGVLHTVATEGATVAVDGILGYLLAEGESPPAAPPESKLAPQALSPASRAPSALAAKRAPGAPVPSTPGARRLATKLEVDIAEVTATGPRGRVTEADVRAHAEQQGAASQPALPAGLPVPSESTTLTGMRKGIADHMRSSIASTAQLSFYLDVDVTEAQKLRREASQGKDVTLTLGHVLMKACSHALARVPQANSVLVDGTVHYFDQVDCGFAVALDEGLIVPLVRDVGGKDIFQIAEETQALVAKAKDGKLSPDEVTGGTFTISVLGIVDGFTPILNTNQSAILGVGRSLEKPVVRRGEVVVREMLTVSLTVDHQVIDGAIAAAFMRRLQQAVERPAQLFK